MTLLSRLGFLLGSLLFFLAIATGAWAQEASSLQEQVQRNSREVARAMDLMTQIQQEFRSMKGQMDASQFLTKESDRVYQDLDMRVSAMEDKIDQIHNLLKELRAAPSAPGGGPPPKADSGEFNEFQSLVDLVNARDFRGAASGFMGFLRKYPGSSYAGNAQYWIAESYYSMGDYANAIQSFQKLVEKYPQNPRVKEAIYKQGLGFMSLKKYDNAKLFFQKVMAAYPNSAEAAKAQTRLHRIEEREKGMGAVAVNQNGAAGTSPSGATEKVYDRPVMKPVPGLGAPTPLSTPFPTPPPQPPPRPLPGSEPQAPNPDSAPLF